jgi:hypothetical protein
MKKNLKKLWISRETLQALTSSEVQKVVGGSVVRSCLSGCAPNGCTTAGGITGDTLMAC